jgi:hypothetical protein
VPVPEEMSDKIQHGELIDKRCAVVLVFHEFTKPVGVLHAAFGRRRDRNDLKHDGPWLVWLPWLSWHFPPQVIGLSPAKCCNPIGHQ